MGAFLATRTPHAAQALWSMAGGYDDPRLNALSFGLLAPNPHNLQPWIIELEGTDAFILHHDASRRLPQTDPFDRQITIGLGCFLEQTRIAASADGYEVALDLYPGGLADPATQAFQEGIKAFETLMNATPAYVALTSNGNTRHDQIDAGARWLRLNLMTTGLGLSLHPVSQALQEYEEMAPLYSAAHDLLAQGGQTVQMLGRLGYGPEIPRTLRWALETKLRDA